nr:hypothetical protein [Tanacetum cinerariifolium]
MVAILEKSDAAEGFKQIIDFLSRSYINHALTVNPHVFISCIKKFWNTAVVKRSGDITRLQALVDKKKIVISKEVVHEILQLNDAEGTNIAYLSKHTTRYISPVLTQKVFANMRRVGKGFSGVETPLFETMLVVRAVDEEEEAQVPAQGDNVQEPAIEEVATDVVPSTPTSPSPSFPVIQSLPPHQSPSPPQPQDVEGSFHLFQQVLDTCSALARVEVLENDKTTQQLKIVKLKARVKKLEKLNKFWNTAVVKRSGVICLPNDEIFPGLARMGHEKPSTKLTFYKAFFSTQWKFFIHMILHSLSAKRTSWNEFSSAMASALICLSSGQRFKFSKYIFESLVHNVDSSSKFYMYPRFIQLIIQTNIARYISPVLTQKVFANMRRAGKGFSGVKTPLFETMLAVRAVDEEEEAQVPAQGDNVQEPTIEEVATDVLDTCSALAQRVKVLENDKTAQQLKIVKLKASVKKLEKLNKDERIELVVDHEKDVEVEGRHADKQAEIYNIDLDHSSKVLSMQEDDTEVQEAFEVVTTAKLITEVVTAATTQVVAASTPISAAKPKILKIAVAPAVSTRRKKGVTLKVTRWNSLRERRMIKFFQSFKPATPLAQKVSVVDYQTMFGELDEQDAIWRNQKSVYGLALVKRWKLLTSCSVHVIILSTVQLFLLVERRFDANMKFLFKSKEEIEKEDEEIIESINETPAQKAAKRRKLNEDDDVFVEATPLAQKSVYGLALVKRWKLLTSCGVHVIILLTVQLFLLVERRSKENTKCVSAANEELTAAKHKLMLLI